MLVVTKPQIYHRIIFDILCEIFATITFEVF